MAMSRNLGDTDISVSAIGLGCMQFSGRGLVSRFYPPLPQSAVDPIVGAALAGGITWFDTAESYGGGDGERRLAAGLVANGVKAGDVTIATKWSPLKRTASSIGKTIDERLDALSPYPIDLHQIHLGRGSFATVDAQVAAMAQLVDRGIIRATGVANFSARQMETALTALAKRGIPLATNQVQISLLHREIEENGVLDTARRLGVTLIAYSPLASGMLSGAFHSDPTKIDNIPLFRRKASGLSQKVIDRTRPLVQAMQEIASAHQASVSQVALAWLIAHYGDTVVAIAGASKPHHATEAAGALRVQLDADEVKQLADLSSPFMRGAPR